jgi:hypothetical protein
MLGQPVSSFVYSTQPFVKLPYLTLLRPNLRRFISHAKMHLHVLTTLTLLTATTLAGRTNCIRKAESVTGWKSGESCVGNTDRYRSARVGVFERLF